MFDKAKGKIGEIQIYQSVCLRLPFGYQTVELTSLSLNMLVYVLLFKIPKTVKT